jgi:hypothetical protein
MAEGNEVKAVYGWRAWSRWALLVGMVLVTCVAVPMLVGMAVTVEVTWVRVVMPLVALLWLVTALIVVWRLALTIEITRTELRWRGLIRRGVLPIAPITAVRPVPLIEAAGIHALYAEGHMPVWVLVSRGFSDLADDLTVGADGPVDVRLSWAVRSPMPGRNLYRPAR